MAWNCIRGGLGWILVKGSSFRGWLGAGTASQGSGHNIKSDRAQEASGQHSQEHGVTLKDSAVEGQELDWMILVWDPFNSGYSNILQS